MRLDLHRQSIEKAADSAPITIDCEASNREFESKEEAFTFYKEHALAVGFSAIIKASRRSRISGKFIDAKFVCTRYGAKPETSVDPEIAGNAQSKKKRGRINRSWSKTDCKACMHVKRRQDGRWIVSNFVKDHNHDLVIDDPGLRNVRRKKMCVSSARARAESFSGDAQVLLEYFSSMQDENPYFFYAVDLSKEQLLRNVFWADAKGRIDYFNFGDVVLFDTMYKRNESKLPFVPFIGMNNHFEFSLLGCGFVADESKSSYAWLLRAWLRSVRGRAPKIILTDQDIVLKEAVAEVFPASRHCFALWHVFSKIPEKLGYAMRQHEEFVEKFHKCILKSQTEEQFEKRWWKMVDRFELRSDKWIQSLHDDRLRWAPVYMKGAFLAGLSSPQRLESVVSALDRSLLRKTSIKEFLQQYKTMLDERYEEEARADVDSWQRQPGLKSPSPYGKQMAQIYTHAVFKKFQAEVLGVVACHPKVEGRDEDATTAFKVHDFEANQVYRVTWNEETEDASCGCRMFEYNGFLCRHVMIVLQICGVNSIPAKYILQRWTKNAKNGEEASRADGLESRDERCSDLYERACKLGDVASWCQETYRVTFAAVEEAVRKCENINNSVERLEHVSLSRPSLPSNNALQESGGVIQGKTKTEEINSGKEKVHLEQETTTTGLQWDQMGYLNFRASTLDCCYGPQQTEQGMV
ncbi:protein FAR-RED IMPAIRED RESPONSE 1 isoform X1 [Salvia splendens]|uniref:protein FAR-RED IMPAIRED RESPONSE 1 isoform X1 n=1 Tax=Salvia splendens TaxID=180675 RepID=UPI001C2658FF|nr:protein FAR-RED IMPAIRED RESPONSE 1 isoform X1 [Salvia splendens]